MGPTAPAAPVPGSSFTPGAAVAAAAAGSPCPPCAAPSTPAVPAPAATSATACFTSPAAAVAGAAADDGCDSRRVSQPVVSQYRHTAATRACRGAHVGARRWLCHAARAVRAAQHGHNAPGHAQCAGQMHMMWKPMRAHAVQTHCSTTVTTRGKLTCGSCAGRTDSCCAATVDMPSVMLNSSPCSSTAVPLLRCSSTYGSRTCNQGGPGRNM